MTLSDRVRNIIGVTILAVIVLAFAAVAGAVALFFGVAWAIIAVVVLGLVGAFLARDMGPAAGVAFFVVLAAVIAGAVIGLVLRFVF